MIRYLSVGQRDARASYRIALMLDRHMARLDQEAAFATFADTRDREEVVMLVLRGGSILALNEVMGTAELPPERPTEAEVELGGLQLFDQTRLVKVARRMRKRLCEQGREVAMIRFDRPEGPIAIYWGFGQGVVKLWAAAQTAK